MHRFTLVVVSYNTVAPAALGQKTSLVALKGFCSQILSFELQRVIMLIEILEIIKV